MICYVASICCLNLLTRSMSYLGLLVCVPMIKNVVALCGKPEGTNQSDFCLIFVFFYMLMFLFFSLFLR